MTALKNRLAVKRLHPLCVAEVTGIDLAVPIPSEDFRAICGKWGQTPLNWSPPRWKSSAPA